MTDASELWWHGQREFCANPACLLHVRADSATVRGGGQWATIDGIVYDRHSMEVGGPLYCMDCRKRLSTMWNPTARPAAMEAAWEGTTGEGPQVEAAARCSMQNDGLVDVVGGGRCVAAAVRPRKVSNME